MRNEMRARIQVPCVPTMGCQRAFGTVIFLISTSVSTIFPLVCVARYTTHSADPAFDAPTEILSSPPHTTCITTF